MTTRLRPRLPLDLALLRAHRELTLADAHGAPLQLLQLRRDLRLALRERRRASLDIGEERVQVAFDPRDPILRARQDGFGHAEPSRDRQAVGAPGDPLHQPIRRREQLRVELQGGVHDAGHLSRKFLQRPQVRRGDRRRPTARELLEDRATERCPLEGIGAGTEFVHEDERVGRRLLEDRGQVLEVRAERRQRGLEALLVTDVGEDVVEAGQRALRPHGRGDPGLQHQRAERERLEEHGLATGVRSRHEEGTVGRGHLEVERDDPHSLREEQRVAAVAHMEPVARRHELRIGTPCGDAVAGATVQ